ncbi:Protein smg5, partial [Sarracenia purpurea var. burkii]
ETKTLNNEQRGKLMKEMGQLWLEAEVKNLESKMKQTAKTNLLTPSYLVVDSEL